MSPQEQRIKIAEACGWKRGKDAVIGRETWPVWHKGPFVASLHTQTMAYYLNDLNAMHEAEKVLTIEDFTEYVRRLHLITKCDDMWKHNRAYTSATAAQRAEAFLRALNLWKDDR